MQEIILKMDKKTVFFILFSTASLIFSDLLTKSIIRRTGGFYVCNQGIAWGIDLPDFFFQMAWTITAVFLLFFFFSSLKSSFISSKMKLAGLLLFFSGALANILDRLSNGCVTDHLEMPFFHLFFFNLADAYITYGSIILFIHILTSKSRA